MAGKQLQIAMNEADEKDFFSRSNFPSDVPGRLFWAEDFAASDGLAYDAAPLSKRIDWVWRWVRGQPR
ncbi:hypothetical protein QFZ42_004862 [Variovorax paradoxus]|nr:hypothetical protein [Variovorax paradoxus]